MPRANNKSLIESRALPNILTLVVALVGIGAGYGATQSTISDLEERVTEYETEIIPLINSVQNGIWQLKLDQAKMAQDVEWIKAEIAKDSDN